jgi:hypothetical protein
MVLALVWFPAHILCEKLGFGGSSLVGSSMVPDWIFFSAIVLISYLYGLVLVLLIRFGKMLRGASRPEEPGGEWVSWHLLHPAGENPEFKDCDLVTVLTRTLPHRLVSKHKP